MAEYIFGGIVLLWLSGQTAVLWRMASIPNRVAQLEDMMVEYMQKGELIAGVAATVKANDERMDRAERRNGKEHEAILGQLTDLTKHVLALKPGKG